MDVILVLTPGTSRPDVDRLLMRLDDLGLDAHVSRPSGVTDDQTVVSLVADPSAIGATSYANTCPLFEPSLMGEPDTSPLASTSPSQPPSQASGSTKSSKSGSDDSEKDP